MSTIVTRAGKGSPLTNTEVDANFINLNTDKYQSGGALGTPASATLTNATGLPLTTGVSGLLPLANGGTGTATPALVAGTNITVTGTWPNQTIAASGGGSGTVTSVDATVPTFLSVTGGPITTSGTLAISYSGTALPIANGGTGQTTAASAITALTGAQTSGYYLRSNGTNASLSTIQVADVPTLNQNTTGTAANVTGTVAVANGGTGTATPALVAGTNVTITGTWPNQTIAASGGGGSGTVTSVDATVPAFLSVTGGPITTSGTLAISYSGTALPIANGGTGQTTASAAFNALSPITTTGDLIIGNGANSATRLGIGTSTYVLTSNGTTATWSAATGGGATGGGSDKIFYENDQTVNTSYSITAGKNAGTFGPVTVANGVTVTVPTGSTWSVV